MLLTGFQNNPKNRQQLDKNIQKYIYLCKLKEFHSNTSVALTYTGEHMQPFGELLKKYILDRGYTVNQFAKKLDFNRGTLYSVFAGTKNMPEDVFLRALTFLSSGPEETALLKAYHSEIYGQAAMEHILFLQQELNRISDRETAPRPEYSTNSTALASALSTLFSRAAKEELPDIYTNYSFSSTVIDDAVYEALTSSVDPVCLRHYVLTETSGSSTENLQTLLSSLRYMDLKQNVSTLSVSDPHLLQTHTPFPYFFVTTRQLILLNRDGSTFCSIDDPAVIDTVFQDALRTFIEAKPIASFISPTFDFRSVIELLEMALPAQGSHICIESQMCLAKSLSDPDFLDAIAAPKLPLRASLIRLVSHHYRELCKRACPTISSASGCLRFLETGIVEDLPQSLVGPAPIPFRRLALLQLLESCENEDQAHTILNEAKLRLPQKFAFILNDSLHSVTITSTEFSWTISVEDPHLRDDFFNFLDYCHRGQLILSKQEASAFLHHLISICEEPEIP